METTVNTASLKNPIFPVNSERELVTFRLSEVNNYLVFSPAHGYAAHLHSSDEAGVEGGVLPIQMSPTFIVRATTTGKIVGDVIALQCECGLRLVLPDRMLEKVELESHFGSEPLK